MKCRMSQFLHRLRIRHGLLGGMLVLSACTMPLPTSDNSSGILGELPGQGSSQDALSELVIPGEGIRIRSGVYNNQALEYLELSNCQNTPSCTHNLPALRLLRKYTFVFNDGSTVLGQYPVFSSRDPREPDTPFRRIFRVVVPSNYQPNTLRTEADIFASGLRIEQTANVDNNPATTALVGTTSYPIARSWQGGKEGRHIELGNVAYSTSRNQLGIGIVYFLRNADRTDLPSQPAPIFDTAPGDLLYSPVRQVFRAIAENQATSLTNDPGRNLRSQEDLLRAVNQGLFRLEDTRIYYNYPVLSIDRPLPPIQLYEMRLPLQSSLPTLRGGAVYALWAETSQGLRKLQTFNVINGRVLTAQQKPPGALQFPPEELNRIQNLHLTLDNMPNSDTPGALLLAAPYQFRSPLQLQPQFQERYQNLEAGAYLLAAPTQNVQNFSASGVWFVKRITGPLNRLPQPQELVAGLPLPEAPSGWVYTGWVRPNLGNTWLSTGRFRTPNGADQSFIFSGPQAGYPFPGGDFLSDAPPGLTFPLNLASSGETEIAISLEPENIFSDSPYLPLYRHLIAKGTPAYTSQALPSTPVSLPTFELTLTSSTQ